MPVFIPWFTDPDYREPVPANFERTPDEEELAEKYSPDEQLMFRRRKIATNGIDLFRQEYPAEPEASSTQDAQSSTQSNCNRPPRGEGRRASGLRRRRRVDQQPPWRTDLIPRS